MAISATSGAGAAPGADHTRSACRILGGTFDLPAQLALPADTVIFSPSNTLWGAELGLDLLGLGSSKFGVRGFYQASADTQTFGGNVYLRIPFEEFAVTSDSGIRIIKARGMFTKAPPVQPAPWTWAGLYLGGHIGGGLSATNFADPFGPSIYGDTVRSPAFLGGGQIGYNWQMPGSRWIFGVEADGSLMASDGMTNSCFSASANIVNSTCRVLPRATGTFTGRIGYAFGAEGRSMVYAKGGLAWGREDISMDLNSGGNDPATRAALAIHTDQSLTLWGGTVGIGLSTP